MTLNAANSQNVAELPIAPTSERKNWLTRKAAPQLTAVQTATARPRMRPGKDFVDHGPHDRPERKRERDDEGDQTYERDEPGSALSRRNSSRPRPLLGRARR